MGYFGSVFIIFAHCRNINRNVEFLCKFNCVCFDNIISRTGNLNCLTIINDIKLTGSCIELWINRINTVNIFIQNTIPSQCCCDDYGRKIRAAIILVKGCQIAVIGYPLESCGYHNISFIDFLQRAINIDALYSGISVVAVCNNSKLISVERCSIESFILQCHC